MNYVIKKRDFIPLLFLVITASYYLLSSIGNFYFSTKQVAGLLLIAAASIMFALKVRYGVLTLGLIFILGWVGLISVSNQNLTYAIQVTLFNVSIPLFNGHPAFFWGTILHVAVSGKHYFGIATTNYWRELFAKQ